MMARQPFATALVGPSGLFQEGLIRILSASNFRIISSAACVHDLLLKSLAQDRSILLIVDADDDSDAAFSQIAVFKVVHPTSHVVVLADRYDSINIVSAFRAGANGYLIKSAAYDAFIKSLELVILGQTILPAEILTFIQNHDAYREYDASSRATGIVLKVALETEGQYTPLLSMREKCILRCLIEGEPNKSIARKINIAEATVKVHVKTILRKIRVHNRTQAAVWAMNNGLFTLDSDRVSPNGEKMTADPHYPQDLLEAQNGARVL
jgi:two-component system nitrate/nitrite response regulator NarL